MNQTDGAKKSGEFSVNRKPKQKIEIDIKKELHKAALFNLFVIYLLCAHIKILTLIIIRLLSLCRRKINLS
jgi:hypothetical protein